jgi:transposase
MGAPEKADWWEARRYRAWELHQQGWKQQDIAAALGVTEGAVSQWLKRGREQGTAALATHPSPGARSRLTPEQREQMVNLLAQGALAHGYYEAVWTSRRVARTFGVKYHRAHVSRLLHQMGQSVQKPLVRASQRDETVIEQWKHEQWPALKKRPKRKDTRCSL